MAWPAAALFVRSELRSLLKPTGSSRDSLYESIAGWVASDIETHTDRRLIFRAPTEDDDAIFTGAFATGAQVVGGQPSSPGRTIVVNFPPTGTAGVVTVTGTVGGVAGVSEVFRIATVADPGGGSPGIDGALTQYGVKFFTDVSAIDVAGAAGGGTLKLGTSLGYVDFYSPDRFGDSSELWANEWPIRQVGALYEDSTRTYAASSLLVEGAGFAVVDGQKLVRLSGSSGSPMSFVQAYRAVKKLSSAGYAGPSNVPGTIKRIALRLAAMYDQEAARGQIEIASGSNALGSWTRTGPAALTPQMIRDLAPFTRAGYFAGGERGYDREAA